MILLSIIAAAAFAVTALSMPFLIKALQRSRVMDIPNQRSSHSIPVPRGGGILIAIPLLGGLLAYGLAGPEPAWRPLAGILLGVTGLGALGFLDDLYSLKARTRLLLQIGLVSGALALVGLPTTNLVLPGVGSFDLGFFHALVCLLFVVGFTNMFNFMDGINGLAGFQAVIAGLGLAVVAHGAQAPIWPVAMAVLVGSTLGFLVFNFPRARVFMGDVGSLPVGFLLALGVLQVGHGPAAQSPPPLWVQTLFIWPFLFEATWTLMLRIKRRQNPFKAHRNHLYQLFVIAGRTHSRVTLGYAAVMALCVTLGILLQETGLVRHPLTGIVFWAVLLVSILGNQILSRKLVSRNEGVDTAMPATFPRATISKKAQKRTEPRKSFAASN